MVKILLVDDDPMLLEIHQLFLEGSGYSVETAESGDQALIKLSESDDFDIVITDLLMPEMNGDELGKKIKQDLNPAPPVICITAADDMDLEKYTGIDSFIAKPVDANILNDAIQKSIK